MRVFFMGSDEYSAQHLKHLVDIGVNVDLVVTQPDRPKGRGKKLRPTPVKETAMRLGLEVIHPKDLRSITERLSSYEIGILVSFGRIIPPEVLRAPKLGIFNVHPSLLPKYRGASPINRALENGEKETGVTIMKVTEKLDAGPIALQRRVEIGPFETFGELERRLTELGKEMLEEFFEILEKGELELTPQDDSLASYAPKIRKEDLIVDFSKECEIVKNKIRAYDPKPGVMSNLNGTIVKLFGVKSIESEKGEPGRIIRITREGALVGCSSGSVLIEKVQFPGKKVVNFWDAFNGRKVKEGDVFTLPGI